MTCRHKPGDPNCSTQREQYLAAKREAAAFTQFSTTPDASDYVVEAVKRVGEHLVLRVRYPNCEKCAYEGNKVMVFLNVSEEASMMWRVIDPHFRDPKDVRSNTTAPSPAARFPASSEGWADALSYAQGKSR